MQRKTMDKLWVLTASFAAFAGGVAALQMERGGARTLALTLCFGVLTAIAVRQTLRRMGKKQD